MFCLIFHLNADPYLIVILFLFVVFSDDERLQLQSISVEQKISIFNVFSGGLEEEEKICLHCAMCYYVHTIIIKAWLK